MAAGVTAPILVADCVGKRFGDRWVLRSASLRAQPGELRALVGRNGAGKSTLLRIAAGLLIPDSGTVHYDARPRIPARLSALAREGLFLLPDHDQLSSAFTLRVHLDFVRPRSARPDETEIIETLGLARHLGAKPHELSSGERRRAELAVAWIRRPRCLLADEPLRNIAPIDGELVLQVLRRMAVEGCAVIVTGHEVSALMAAVHHVTWCTDGSTYELGPPFMARNDDRFRTMYLGTRG
jgi:ABC-type multidrug transport system ATPase subunit